jgi:hypothetical protein
MPTSLADLLNLQTLDREVAGGDLEVLDSSPHPREVTSGLVYIDYDGPEGPIHGCQEAPPAA